MKQFIISEQQVNELMDLIQLATHPTKQAIVVYNVLSGLQKLPEYNNNGEQKTDTQC